MTNEKANWETVLEFISSPRVKAEGALSAREIAEMVRMNTATVNVALKRLESMHLAEKLGTSYTGARCWGITDAGERWLREEALDEIGGWINS